MSAIASHPARGSILRSLNFAVVLSLTVVTIVMAMAVFGPPLLGLSSELRPTIRLRPPGAEHWFGTDNLGRDIFVRTISGSRNSVIVGLSTAVVTLIVGGMLGLLSGYIARLDRVLMRVSDGLMAIPGILLAIALVSVLGGGLVMVVIAIAVPEIPRTARLMRSVVLTLRELPYVAAAVSVGSSTPKILFQHIVPNAFGALMVQGTFVCASAILSEAALSFLGVGTPPDIPSWGNIMSGGRQYFQIAPWIIGFPGLMLSALVLSVNILGDHFRDTLDPRLMRRRAG
jgi:peptide/nickel transport system permease protein